MSKKQKMLDELLEEVLMPEDEQPFEIPENWCWVRSTEVFDIQYGKGLPTSQLINEGYSVYGANGKIGFYSTYTQVESRVLMTCRGATCGTINVSEPFSFVTNNSMILTPKWNVDTNFIQYLFMSQDKNVLISGTAQPQITVKAFSEFYLPLPPINEQKRIASKIEILFSKIDEANRLIEEAKATFKLRRAAILTKAFEIYEPTSYKMIEEVCKIKNGYAFKSKDFVDEGVQIVRMGNLYQNQLDLSRSPVFLPADYNEKLLDKYCIKNGDILLTLTGTKYKRDYGYAVKIENLDEDLLLNQRIMSLTPNTEDDYLYYFLQTSKFRNDFFSFETGGVNQGNVGSKSVANIKIPWINDISKRREIVNFIQKQLHVEKYVSEILNTQMDIEKLKKSLLSKAFKGELGTYDPANESAIELLKSILQEKL